VSSPQPYRNTKLNFPFGQSQQFGPFWIGYRRNGFGIPIWFPLAIQEIAASSQPGCLARRSLRTSSANSLRGFSEKTLLSNLRVDARNTHERTTLRDILEKQDLVAPEGLCDAAGT
jgi:hypothetical protein